MATTTYFEETVEDQGKKTKLVVELGRSSFYAGCKTPSGEGEDSIYLKIDDTFLVMDRATAKRFVEAVNDVGSYHGFV